VAVDGRLLANLVLLFVPLLSGKYLVRNRFIRVAAFAALAVGLSTSTAVAQNGSNFMILNNGFDAIYAGIGAGGGQVAGVDGFGTWMEGETMRGNTLTTLGDFGYRQIGWREAPCVLGAAFPGLGLKWPTMIVMEYDGVNPYGGASLAFTQPTCGVLGCVALGNSAGVAPYGIPAGSTSAFVFTGFASGVPVPSGTVALIPNNGIAPSSNGGTVFVIAAASNAEIPIASTGFCWGVQFNWAPSAVVSLDDVNGWWHWRTNSADGNQYWSVSNDENQIWQSNTVFSDLGATDTIEFFNAFDYETYSISPNPSTNVASSPAGSAGTGVYYATGAGVPNSGSSLNGGFDMGRHGGLSLNGPGGTTNPITGLGGQDPAGSPTPGLIPTLGAVTWNNAPSSLAGPDRFHVTWIQTAFDASFGLDPAGAADLAVAMGNARLPLTDQIAVPGAIQPETNLFLPFFTHTVADQTGVAAWPDPFGFPGGTFGIPPMVGSSIHLPTLYPAGVAIGLPVALQVGSSQMKTAGGPIMWGGPNQNAPSQSTLVPLVD
jgi:hypothetical protein